MTRDDIIELALQCGIWIPLASGPEREQTIDKLRRFAALVAAAERDALRAALRHEADCVEAAKAEIEALRAKIAEMEKQEPVAWADAFGEPFRKKSEIDGVASPLYALPGAQNVPKAVAYLDLGTGGYMDIGTDLTDEALAALPKGRHMLGIVGTYGVDGYVPAHPAPSEQDESVRKSWVRFSNELHRSPDAPYPGMSEAFEQHFSQSFTDRDWRVESGIWAAAWKAAKHHGAQGE